MAVVDAFWVGAREVAPVVDLVQLARAAGGWTALEGASAQARIAWGVPPALAWAWDAARPETTRGTPIVLSDPQYPEALRRTPHPPAVLYVEGDPTPLSAPGIAVVGTRRCTRHGAAAARALGHRIAAAGWTVVSGLARGIDGEAHRGALDAGRTVAVLGHGLDHTAPARHQGLRDAIVARGGAVVSVWPDALPPRPHTFPKRNAWIAGLSEVVVVVEAPPTSGALHTARFALAMGREVAAVPGRMGDPASVGTNRLLRDGASVIADVDDAVARWTGHRPPPIDAWLSCLFEGGSLEEAARRSHRAVSEVAAAIARLEVEGRVVRLPGGRYAPRQQETSG